jgi:hypothetical protein
MDNEMVTRDTEEKIESLKRYDASGWIINSKIEGVVEI